jgi:DNA-binding PadR family transcriptional regulator
VTDQGLERAGLLKSHFDARGGRRLRLYRITGSGQCTLEKARAKVDELYDELHKEHPKIGREKTKRRELSFAPLLSLPV